MITPKCTIFKNWTGPECCDPAVSMNDYGGFQCEFHNSIVRCHLNKPGPVVPINKEDPKAQEKLAEAYALFLNTNQEQSYKTASQVVIAAHNVPQNMLRRQ